MKIEYYSFGNIIIDGKTYTSDVVIYPDRVDAAWWREEGHRLQIKDLTSLLNAKPHLLIIGTGYAGVMSVPEAVKGFIRSKGIEVIVEKTGKAVELYNAAPAGKTVIAAFHITC